MDEVVNYQTATTITESQKVLMRLHDAFLTHPSGLGPDVRAEVLEHFSPAHIAEIVFKFFWWSTNRATVTLGDDAPHDPNRLTSYNYAEDGEFIPPPPPTPSVI